jgi:ribosomal protein L19
MGLLEKIVQRPPSRIVALRTIPWMPKADPPPLCQEQVSLGSMGLMDHLRGQYRRLLDRDNRWRLFDAKSPDYAPAGSVLTVTYVENKTTNRLGRFTGVLLAIRRGVSTPTFLLRGIVEGVAVEQVFSVHSPLLKNIVVDKRATVLKGRKLYWLRDVPHSWMAKLTTPAPTFLNDATQRAEPLSTQSRLPERLHDVVLRSPQAVKFDRRRGVPCYPKKKINKRK